MAQVAYNTCFGGFGLSTEARVEIAKLKHPGTEITTRVMSEWYTEILADGKAVETTTERHDPILIQVIKKLRGKANGRHAKIKLQTIKGNKYRIDEYDGSENVFTPEDDEDIWTVI